MYLYHSVTRITQSFNDTAINTATADIPFAENATDNTKIDTAPPPYPKLKKCVELENERYVCA